MATRSQVFVVNKGTLNFDKAERFGDLHFITENYVKFDNLRKLSMQVGEVLSTSKSTDFLVLSGNNLLCVIVAQLWINLHGNINVLHWDTRSEDYTPLCVIPSQYPILK